jgi:hypothetical protein
MSNKIKLRSVVFCEDVRQEASGKEILIGVYSDSMLFSQFPTMMRQLVVRIVADLLDKSVNQATIYLKDEHQTVLNTTTLDLSSQKANEHTLFGAFIQGLTLYAPGIYSVYLSLDSDPPFKISDFSARTPQSDEERRRLQTSPNA